MSRSLEKELAELDRLSAYQEGYRDGWVDALRIAGVLTPELVDRVRSKQKNEPSRT